MSGNVDPKVEHLPVEVVTEPHAVAVRTSNALDIDTAEFVAALERRKANRKALMDWIRDSLKKGQDYHVIKDKKSLSKAGSEKVLGMLGLTPTFPAMDDYIAMSSAGSIPDNIVLKCLVLNANGEIVAQGIGARSLRQDEGDLNKTLKMATKSAQIDATLRCAGLSELFTQDLEDMPASAVGDAGSGQSQPASNLQGVEHEMASKKEDGYCWFCDQKRHIKAGDIIVKAKIPDKEDAVWGAKECYVKNILQVEPEKAPVDGGDITTTIVGREELVFGTDAEAASKIEAARAQYAGNVNLGQCAEAGLNNYLEYLQKQ